MSGEDPNISGVAGRYATALFELANEQGAVDRVLGELATLKTALAESGDLMRLVRSPVFQAEDQTRGILGVLDSLGIGGLTAQLIGLLARNRRLFVVGDVIEAFRSLVARHRGEMTAEVTSAHPLNDEQLQALRETLRGSLGRDVQLNTAVDPSLIGGLIVKVGSRMIDSSIRTKLNGLRVAMKGVG